MLPGVMVKELAITVSSSDDSYMPKNITLSAGSSENSLREIKKVTVPRDTSGKVILLQNLVVEHRFVQVNFKGCHSDGCDVRVRGLHVKGYKYVEGASLLRGQVCWGGREGGRGIGMQLSAEGVRVYITVQLPLCLSRPTQ